MTTILKELGTKMYRGNQTRLAGDLCINRGTLRKYINDEKGEYHQIIESKSGELELFTNQSRKK